MGSEKEGKSLKVALTFLPKRWLVGSAFDGNKGGMECSTRAFGHILNLGCSGVAPLGLIGFWKLGFELRRKQ